MSVMRETELFAQRSRPAAFDWSGHGLREQRAPVGEVEHLRHHDVGVEVDQTASVRPARRADFALARDVVLAAARAVFLAVTFLDAALLGSGLLGGSFLSLLG